MKSLVFRVCVLLLMFTQCKSERIAIYSGVIHDKSGVAITGVEVTVIENGKVLGFYPDTLTSETIEAINRGEYRPRCISDSLGRFKTAYVQTTWKESESYLIFRKPEFKDETLKIEWGPHLDTVIILKP